MTDAKTHGRDHPQYPVKYYDDPVDWRNWVMLGLVAMTLLLGIL